MIDYLLICDIFIFSELFHNIGCHKLYDRNISSFSEYLTKTTQNPICSAIKFSCHHCANGCNKHANNNKKTIARENWARGWLVIGFTVTSENQIINYGDRSFCLHSKNQRIHFEITLSRT